MLRWALIIAAIVLGLALVAVMAVTWWVEHEAPFEKEVLADTGRSKALILFHPSRDARFSDQLTLAMARGFETAGISVDRMTMTSQTPTKPSDYAVIAVVANTFYGRPDRPTRRYLARAEFAGVPVIGVIAGAGSTERAQGQLEAALKRAGGAEVEVRSLWIMRPNEPAQSSIDNRQMAERMARRFALDTARGIAPAASEVHPMKKAAQGR